MQLTYQKLKPFALSYLTAPLAVFFAGYLRAPFAVAGLAVLAFAWWYAVCKTPQVKQVGQEEQGITLSVPKLVLLFALMLCGVVWILVTNALFGWESTQTSVQWLFSVTSLLPYTVGQMEWVMLVANFLIFFAEVAFVLMASVWAKNNLTALSVALISVVAPLIVYMVVPGSFGEWLSTLIPAGGIGLSNALLYKMISFDFLYAGGHAFFQADVLLASAPIKIVLLVGLAAWGYLRKTKVA